MNIPVNTDYSGLEKRKKHTDFLLTAKVFTLPRPLPVHYMWQPGMGGEGLGGGDMMKAAGDGVYQGPRRRMVPSHPLQQQN